MMLGCSATKSCRGMGDDVSPQFVLAQQIMSERTSAALAAFVPQVSAAISALGYTLVIEHSRTEPNVLGFSGDEYRLSLAEAPGYLILLQNADQTLMGADAFARQLVSNATGHAVPAPFISVSEEAPAPSQPVASIAYRPPTEVAQQRAAEQVVAAQVTQPAAQVEELEPAPSWLGDISPWVLVGGAAVVLFLVGRSAK